MVIQTLRHSRRCRFEPESRKGMLAVSAFVAHGCSRQGSAVKTSSSTLCGMQFPASLVQQPAFWRCTRSCDGGIGRQPLP
jgi:hypothetical protein